MKRKFYHKIDPCVTKIAKASSNDSFKVILYANQPNRTKSILDDMGISVSTEVPLINGYIAEIPSSMVSKIAGRREIQYVAADLDIKAQMMNDL